MTLPTASSAGVSDSKNESDTMPFKWQSERIHDAQLSVSGAGRRNRLSQAVRADFYPPRHATRSVK